LGTISSQRLRNLTVIMAKSQRDYEKEVGSWGFSHVFTWTDSP
jgi:hypothetical protein